jgi:hypothetical protein
VLDLPHAVRHAAPILAAEGMGDRVVHREGDALRDDLGADAYDVALLSSVAHHLTAEQNAALTLRVAEALRPQGVFAVVEPLRMPTASGARQFGALTEFYFGLTSRAGTWASEEIAHWQHGAGLQPLEPMTLTSGVLGIQAATKPAAADHDRQEA